MTRLVFHAGNCWPVPLDETMRQAAAVGYAGIELAPHPLFLPPAHWSAEDAGRLRNAATDAGLLIASLDLGHAELLGAIPFEPSLMAPMASSATGGSGCCARRSRLHLGLAAPW
jgi:hypothetical protein